MKKYAIYLAICFLWNNASACSIPSQGINWTHDELIEKTETIYLATPISEDHHHKFKVIEVLKGEEATEFQWRMFRSKEPHKSKDFNIHTDPAFWNEGNEKVARAPFYSGGCTLQFTFVYGENYLIFKESPGHFHSAEIIANLNDKWYQYVRSRIDQKK